MKKFQPFLTAGDLKRIALLTMIIDHFAVAIIIFGIMDNETMFSEAFGINAFTYYQAFRIIGRLAFPIYLYLLIEGFHKTKNIMKYGQRLLVLALVSEIPFDLALFDQWFNWNNQNIFFELLAVLLMCYLLDKYKDQWYLQFIIPILIAGVTYAGHFDYDYYGIIAAFIMFHAYGNRNKEALAIFPAFLFEAYSIFVYASAGLIYAYNGKRGKVNQPFHYWAYPGHLLILYLVRLVVFKN